MSVYLSGFDAAQGDPARIAVLGRGSIGSVVAHNIADGGVPGAVLGAVLGRPTGYDSPTLADALVECDVVVECAGPQAVRDHAVDIVEAGCDLVLTSVGALYDDDLRQRLAAAGPGRAMCTNGAIGGLDIIAAAYRSGMLDEVQITSTKRPDSLVRPWMSEAQVRRLGTTDEAFEVFSGTPANAARQFPDSLNVAMALDLAVGGHGHTRVVLVADPGADGARHAIDARGAIGHYSIVMENRTSYENPKSSAVVPFSVIQTLSALTVARHPPARVRARGL